MSHTVDRIRQKAGVAWGELTHSLRGLPDYVIIGAQKCGTTSLYYHLTRHPQVRPARFKELHFFDRHYQRGEQWYRGHFPRRRRGAVDGSPGAFLSGEATPDYFAHPEAPQRAAGVIPSARLIALLRNPVTRAYSHYQHNVRKGREHRAFEQAIDEELRRATALAPPAIVAACPYLGAGLYGYHLKRWLRVFRQEQVLVIRSEDYFQQPRFVEQVVLPFLGLPGWPMGGPPGCNAATYPAIPAAVVAELAGFYEPHNGELRQLCGQQFQWSR